MWNPFRKKTDKEKEAAAKLEAKIEAMPGMKELNVVQRYMTKRVLSMDGDGMMNICPTNARSSEETIKAPTTTMTSSVKNRLRTVPTERV